ncbi:MAG: hypothetical protein ACK41T_01705 [Pseudobdellovibrio sp.]
MKNLFTIILTLTTLNFSTYTNAATEIPEFQASFLLIGGEENFNVYDFTVIAGAYVTDRSILAISNKNLTSSKGVEQFCHNLNESEYAHERAPEGYTPYSSIETVLAIAYFAKTIAPSPGLALFVEYYHRTTTDRVLGQILHPANNTVAANINVSDSNTRKIYTYQSTC